MKSVSLNGIARVNLGKKFSKQLRNNGVVPCVIYGGGKSPVHIAIEYNQLRKIIYSPNTFILDINIEQSKYNTIVRDIQFHPLNDTIVHVDFLQLTENEFTSLEVPVKLTGNSIGVRNGGVLNLVLRKLIIKSFPKDIPDNIEIDITDLRIGQSIRILDLLNENYEFVQGKENVIVSVKTARNIIEEEEELEESAEGQEGDGDSKDQEDSSKKDGSEKDSTESKGDSTERKKDSDGKS